MLDPMSKKRQQVPMAVKQRSVIVKCYQVRNKAHRVRTKDNSLPEQERFSFMVSFFADGKRQQKMFAEFPAAKAETDAKAIGLSRGELEVRHLRSSDARVYTNTVHLLEPTGVALELAAKEYVAAWQILGGKASIIEAAREFARSSSFSAGNLTLPRQSEYGADCFLIKTDGNGTVLWARQGSDAAATAMAIDAQANCYLAGSALPGLYVE